MNDIKFIDETGDTEVVDNTPAEEETNEDAVDASAQDEPQDGPDDGEEQEEYEHDFSAEDDGDDVDSDGLTAEELAYAQGWRPKEEYRGNPNNWTDAEEFLKTAENNLPVMRKQLRERSEDVVVLKRHVKELTEANKALAGKVGNIEQQANTKEMSEIEKELNEAVLDGDTTKALELTKKYAEAGKKVQEPKVEQPTQEQQTNTPQEVPQEVNAWIEKNGWFNKDQTLNSVAQAIHMDLQRTNPELSIADNLEAVSREIKKRFPVTIEASMLAIVF